MLKTLKSRTSARGASQQMVALLRLRELVLSGEYSPGARLAEIPLANRLQVSRTPLRLALLTLEDEGLVEEYPTGGYVVRSLRRSDIFDSIEIRGLLEGLAVRLAVERRTADSMSLNILRGYIAEIDRGLKRIKSAPDEALRIYIQHNKLFHAKILELADSAALSREMDRITAMPFAAPSSGFVRAQIKSGRSQHILRIGQDQHKSIVDALEAGEAARVEMLMREHSRIARRNLEIALEDGFPPLVPGLHLIQGTLINRNQHG